MTLLEQIIVIGMIGIASASLFGGVMKVKSDMEQKIQVIQDQNQEYEKMLKGVMAYVEYNVE